MSALAALSLAAAKDRPLASSSRSASGKSARSSAFAARCNFAALPHSLPKASVSTTPVAAKMLTPPRAKPSADEMAHGSGSLGARMRAFNGKIAPLDKIAAHRAHDRALFLACQTAQFINLPLVAAVEGIIFAYYTKYPHGSPLKAVTKELRFVKFTCLCEKSCYNIFCIELYIRSI